MRSTQSHIPVPRVLKLMMASKITLTDIDSNEGAISIQSARCGAESSHVLDMDDNLFSTGWNEHGNLAIGLKCVIGSDCCSSWMATSGVKEW